MGRKRKRGRKKHSKKRQRAEERLKKRKGPSPSVIRLILLIVAVVALVALAVVVFSTQVPDDDDNGNGNGNGPPPINKVPVPKASVTPAEAFLGENVTFDGSRSYDPNPGDYIVNFTWEVHQDWITGPVIHKYYGRKFNKSYDTPGALYVVLFVTDDNGGKNSTVSVNQYGGKTLMIKNREPVAEAGNDVNTTVGKDVYFDGEASHDQDGEITDHHWDFGDGNSSKGSFVSHVYAAPGTYTVTLTVTDNNNGKGMDTMEVIVK